MRKVAIVAGKRIPFARSFTNYQRITNQELMTAAMRGLIGDIRLEGQTLGEVVLGSVIKHTSDWNFSREVTIGSGLSANTPAYDISQACGTSLEAAIAVGNKIALGQIDVGIAGGIDSNSDVPLVYPRSFNYTMLEAQRAKTTGDKIKAFAKLRIADLKPVAPGITEPRTGLSMGESCELMAKQWKISREEQDQLALESHHKAAKAYADGFYKNLIVPYAGLDRDNNVRGDTTLEKLAKLKPAFDRTGTGTLTAGNSSALTDGAACVLMCSEDWAKQRGLPVLAYMTFCETAAVDFVKAEGLLMAPTYAVARMLKKANLKLQDFDFYEIHEAFAAQVLCTLKAWESEEFCRTRLGWTEPLGKIDRTKMNVKGGSVAIGHPFAATGARIVANLAHILAEKGSGRGLISICTGGGMGVTAILER